MVKSLAQVSPNAQLRLDDFADRAKEVEVFTKYLNAAFGTRLPVLMFHGAPGVGKTLLLERFRQEANKANIPFACLDLETRSGSVTCYSDSATALAALRSQFGVPCPRFDVAYAVALHKEDAKPEPVRTPLAPSPAAAPASFSAPGTPGTPGNPGILGSAGTLAASAALTIPGTPGSPGAPGSPGDRDTQFAIDMTAEMAQIAISMPVINVASWMAMKSSSPRWKQFESTPQGEWLKSMFGNQYLLTLRRLEAQEIYPQLSERLLQDLHEHLTYKWGACRGVIFLDSFEALSPGASGGSGGSGGARQQREQWVRELYASDTPVLLVIAGRHPLQWEEADKDFAQPSFLEQHLVEGFSEPDARAFLVARRIERSEMQDAMLAASRMAPAPHSPPTQNEKSPSNAPGSYLPQSLAMAVDASRAASHLGKPLQPADFSSPAPGPGPAGVAQEATRFLRSLNQTEAAWIVSLAATPRFDEEAAKAAWSTQDSVQRNAAWKDFQHYSFVSPLPEGWWTVHPRGKPALRQGLAQPAAQQLKIHDFWQGHWRSRAGRDEDRFAALAWFHEYALNPAEALQNWKGLAERARKDQRMADHYRLLEWWGPTGLEENPPATQEQANALISLSVELWNATLGARRSNLFRAIDACQAALAVYNKSEFAAHWAMVQNNIGRAYRAMPGSDRQQNFARAIACYEAALGVSTQEVFPEIWAMTQNNLGKAFCDLPSGEKRKNLDRAVTCHQSALRVFTQVDFPHDWAQTQNQLGNAYRALADWVAGSASSGGGASGASGASGGGANLNHAIACFESALSVLTQTEFPLDWAWTQNDLGNAYLALSIGDHGGKLSQAVACYQAALRVFNQDDYPREWALTQFNLGNACRALPTGDRAHNLGQAILCYEAALRVYTEARSRQEWAATQQSLGDAYRESPAASHSGPAPAADSDAGLAPNLDNAQLRNLDEALDHYKAALRVFTEAAFPRQWAQIQVSAGYIYRDVPGGNRGRNLDKAAAHYKAALRVFTEAGFPRDWAAAMTNLGEVYAILPTGDRAHNQRQAASCFESALRVYTPEKFPAERAAVQKNLDKLRGKGRKE